MKIRTQQGDTVDRLLWHYLQRNDENITDAFWRLNPHAAAQGPIFPIGIILELPKAETTSSGNEQRVSPWD